MQGREEFLFILDFLQVKQHLTSRLFLYLPDVFTGNTAQKSRLPFYCNFQHIPSVRIYFKQNQGSLGGQKNQIVSPDGKYSL